MEEEGKKRVEISGMNDKRQITNAKMVTIYRQKLFMLVKLTGVYQKLNFLLDGMSHALKIIGRMRLQPYYTLMRSYYLMYEDKRKAESFSQSYLLGNIRQVQSAVHCNCIEST